MARIAVVDDLAPLRQLVRLTLSSAGHEVFEAADAEAAWRVLTEERPDVMILDVMMPGQSGLDVCRAIRADPGFGGLPVIILTANGRSDTEADALAAGATCFMTKPFRPQALLATVARLAGAPHPS